MKTMNVREIYYTSSEKSLITGMPGFGVRTYTRDMSPAEADEVAMLCNPAYNVEMERALSLEQLNARPAVVYDYAPQYEYRCVETNTGAKYYVVMRTVYVAVDYGFFGDQTGAMRAGSNSFSHLMVFTEEPPLAVFRTLNAAKGWVPADYTCRRDNPELRRLLTGAPVALEPATVTIDDVPLTVAVATPGMDRLLPALMQAHINRMNGTEPDLTKIVVIAREADTARIVEALGALPAALTREIFFTTNFTSGYSLPDTLNMVFVNEHNTNEIYTDNYITVNLIEGTTKNVDFENVVLARVSRLVGDADVATLATVLRWFLTLDKKQVEDCAFSYDILLATSTDHELQPDATDAEFITRAMALKLPKEERRALVDKINRLINSMIVDSDSGAMVMKGIDLAGTFLEVGNGACAVAPEAVQKLARIIFLRGADGYLGRMVQPSNVGVICKLIRPEQMGAADSFFAALAQSDNVEVWAKLLRHYFRGTYSADMRAILDAIYRSSLSNADKNDLVEELFPLTSSSTYVSEIVDWYRANPRAIIAIDVPVSRICMAARDECFSRLLGPETPREVLDHVRPDVESYFARRIETNPDSTMEQVALMIKKMTPEVFERLDATGLFDLYLDCVYERPMESTAKVIDNIKRFGVRLPDKVLDRMNALQCLLTEKIPAEVNEEVMTAATKIGDLSTPYLTHLAEQWILTAPTATAVGSFLSRSRVADPAMVGALLNAVWHTESRIVSPARVKYVEAIVDNARWSSDAKKQFVGTCPDDLAAAITRSDTLMGKLSRKFTGLFRK